MPRSPQRKFSALTLIELLMAIGIIVVLLALLAPVLTRAKEYARRENCLSNLHQVHLAFAEYAQDSGDVVPLGYRLSKQFNYMVYSGTAQKIVLFGVLVRWDPARNWRVLYCPSDTNLQTMFNTPLNPWPPDLHLSSTTNVYAGYGCRPDKLLPDDWTDIPVGSLPKLADFKEKAIFSDLAASPSRLDSRHETGVNTVFGDGSAKWVDRALFSKSLNQCSVAAPLPTFNRQQGEIWNTFDAQR